MALHAADGHLESWAPRVAWMPAHVTQLRMQLDPPSDSRRRAVSWQMWRANRLVDHTAKHFARQAALPGEYLQLIRTARGLYSHEAALLGVVTWAANHIQQAEDGTLGRDSAGERPRAPRKRAAPDTAAGAAAAGQLREATHPPNPPTRQAEQAASRKAARRLATLERTARAEVAEARALAERVAQAVARAGPLQAQPASSRIAALTERVRARQQTHPTPSPPLA